MFSHPLNLDGSLDFFQPIESCGNDCNPVLSLDFQWPCMILLCLLDPVLHENKVCSAGGCEARWYRNGLSQLRFP